MGAMPPAFLMHNPPPHPKKCQINLLSSIFHEVLLSKLNETINVNVYSRECNKITTMKKYNSSSFQSNWTFYFFLIISRFMITLFYTKLDAIGTKQD